MQNNNITIVSHFLWQSSSSPRARVHSGAFWDDICLISILVVDTAILVDKKSPLVICWHTFCLPRFFSKCCSHTQIWTFVLRASIYSLLITLMTGTSTCSLLGQYSLERNFRNIFYPWVSVTVTQ